MREYQRESFELFLDMLDRVNLDTVSKLFAIQPARHEEDVTARSARVLHEQGRGRAIRAEGAQDRAERPLPLRQRQEIQEMLRQRVI